MIRMNLETRISILSELGKSLDKRDLKYTKACDDAYNANNWFTHGNIEIAIEAIKKYFLEENKLQRWTDDYTIIKDNKSEKNVGLIMAGNIPLVGFHDLISVFVSGHIALLKLSSRDEVLMKYILDLIFDIEPEARKYLIVTDRINYSDAVIATGSNNTYRYFEYYFRNIPTLLRKNRNGAALILGDETKNELKELAFDIQSYFGLGCRNVSKLYVPETYDFSHFIEILDENEELKNHNKYRNNFDYNLAVSLINKERFMQGENVLLFEDIRYLSRIATLHYEYYSAPDIINARLRNDRDDIQVFTSSKGNFSGLDFEVRFGQTQVPGLLDYADGVDTINFLTNL